MKPKNVMLLGFINRAVEYIDRHMDEEPDARLAELKNIDLASLKDELADNLDSSLGTMQSTMSTLLKAGNEAFDRFIESNKNRTSVDEINRIFNVDIDESRKNNQEKLASLLAFYNLEDDFEFDDDQEIVEDDNTTDDEPIYELTPEDRAFMQEIVKNATAAEDSRNISLQYSRQTNEGIDSIFNEIVENENNEVVDELLSDVKKTDNEDEEPAGEVLTEIPDTAEKEPEEKIAEDKTDKTYVSTLIDDLKQQFEEEEAIKREKEEKNKEIYDRIGKIYPYLPKNFVKSVYDLKDSLGKEYPLGKQVVLLHRINFKSVEGLRQFVEIGLNHDYQINADEDKLIVDIFRQFENSDGKILANIYEIANQGYLLNGTYEGYNVIIDDEE